MAKVKVFQTKVKHQVQGHKVPCEKSCHKEYTYEIWKLYLKQFESYYQG